MKNLTPDVIRLWKHLNLMFQREELPESAQICLPPKLPMQKKILKKLLPTGLRQPKKVKNLIRHRWHILMLQSVTRLQEIPIMH